MHMYYPLNHYDKICNKLNFPNVCIHIYFRYYMCKLATTPIILKGETQLRINTANILISQARSMEREIGFVYFLAIDKASHLIITWFHLLRYSKYQ